MALKEKIKINNKIIIGCFLAIIGLTIIFCNSLYNKIEKKEVKDKINNFIEEQSDATKKTQENINENDNNKKTEKAV